jgi:hypothetical protein
MNAHFFTAFVLIIACDILCRGQIQPKQYTEKVYLHTDCDHYDTGDDIWFKAYVIDASTNRLSPVARNLHVELISPGSEIIQRRILRITEGLGNGDFQLVDSLPSGHYRIRAYTNFMRNFDDHFFFTKEIAVINPDDKSKELYDSISNAENKIDISFFPEGGSLVDNVSSIVAFKAVNALGKGCDVTGELFSSKGDLITSFKSKHLGMGYFVLNPVPGLNYYAVIRDRSGADNRANLPGSFPVGIAIHLFPVNGKKLLIRVSTNEQTLPSILDRELIISCSARGLITKTSRIKINALISNFIIPVNDLPAGVISVTLSEAEGTPLCERLVYLQKRDNVYLTLLPGRQQYTPREQVTLKVLFSDDASYRNRAFLSLSATENRADSDLQTFPTSISSWFLLESDIRGPVEDPSYYFDVSNETRLEDLDLLLMTQGWRDFKWKYDLLNSFRHEDGFNISGRVERLLSKKPVKEAKVSIGIFGSDTYAFLISDIDSSGRFNQEGVDITGSVKVVATVTDKKSNLAKGYLSLDSVFYKPAEVNPSTTNLPALLPSKYIKLKEEAVVKSTIRKKYKLGDTIMLSDVIVSARKTELNQVAHVKESRSRYGQPDKEVIMTPSLQMYSDIYQVLTGRVAGVSTDRSTGSITIRNNTPLILMDGLPQSGPLENIPLNIIDRIDILKWSNMYGFLGGGGVINIITKRGEINAYRPPPNSSDKQINGFDKPRIFYSPKYNKPDPLAFKPDTRTTIFWDPDLSVENYRDTTLNWFNADQSATIDVIIEGITIDGVPVTGKTRYEVTGSNPQSELTITSIPRW